MFYVKNARSMKMEDGTTLNGEIEKLAEGLESRDFPYAAVCANKIIQMLDPQPPSSEEALKTGWVAEAHKSVKALESKDFGLASMCLRKAVKAFDPAGLKVDIPCLDEKAARHYLEEIAICLSAQEFPNVGVYVRKAAARFQFPASAASIPNSPETIPAEPA